MQIEMVNDRVIARKKESKLFPGEEELKIGSLSQLTGVKAGTIRFYEKCGFLEPWSLRNGCLTGTEYSAEGIFFRFESADLCLAVL